MPRKYTKGVGSSQRVKLTERFVNSVKQPPEGKSLFLDTERRGFALSVASGGTKSYLCIRRVHGRQVRFKFGVVGEFSVAEARQKAEGILARMGLGENPVEQRRQLRAEARRAKIRGITLRSALNLREATLRTKQRSEKTIEGDRYVLEKYLAAWLDRELLSLTRDEVRRRHAAIAAEIAGGKHRVDKWRRRGEGYGTATANRTFRAFRACWQRAARQHPEIGLCPTLNIDWFPERPKKAPISGDELASLYKRITALKSPLRRDLWRVMLFTGLRRKSACEMRWADVDLEARTLRVPNPKGGEARAFTLPLSGYLVDVLKARHAEHGKLCGGVEKMRPWVWPSAEAESGHVEEPREDSLGISPHDCRRLFLTTAESTDASPYAIKLLVNHALPRADVTAGYMALDVERLRPVMEAISARLSALCEPGPRGRVLPMKKRARAGA